MHFGRKEVGKTQSTTVANEVRGVDLAKIEGKVK